MVIFLINLCPELKLVRAKIKKRLEDVDDVI